MLQPDPARRWSAEQVLMHAWVRGPEVGEAEMAAELQKMSRHAVGATLPISPSCAQLFTRGDADRKPRGGDTGGVVGEAAGAAVGRGGRRWRRRPNRRHERQLRRRRPILSFAVHVPAMHNAFVFAFVAARDTRPQLVPLPLLPRGLTPQPRWIINRMPNPVGSTLSTPTRTIYSRYKVGYEY